MPEDAYTVEPGPTDARGRVFLSIRRGAHELFGDRVDPHSQGSVDRFIKNALKRIPAIQPDRVPELEDAVMLVVRRIRSTDRARPAEGAATPTSRVCAPPDRRALQHGIDEGSDRGLAAMPDEVRRAAEELLRAPDLLRQVVGHLGELGVAAEESNKALLYIGASSRLLPKPLYVLVRGPSTAGKTFLLDNIASLVPPEAKLVMTATTAKAFYNMPSDRLMHAFVFAGERSLESEENLAVLTKPIREMYGGRDLTYSVPVQDEDGRWNTIEKTVLGPAGFSESTTKERINEEDENRYLVLDVDTSKEKVKQAKRAYTERKMGRQVPVERITAVHHALQRMLRRVEVRIPFLAALEDFVPDEPPQIMRAWAMIVSCIEAHALLHQRQRRVLRRAAEGSDAEMKVVPPDQVQHGDVVIATLQDYAGIRDLIAGPLGRALGSKLSGAVERFGQELGEWCEERGSPCFRTNEAELRFGSRFEAKTVKNYLTALRARGSVRIAEPSGFNQPALWHFLARPDAAALAWLPTAERLREAFGRWCDERSTGAQPREAAASSCADDSEASPRGIGMARDGGMRPERPTPSQGEFGTEETPPPSDLRSHPAVLGPPRTCRPCGGHRWWRSIYGAVACLRCHPPAAPHLVACILDCEESATA